MILAVDIGNTRIKAAVFEQTNILEVFIIKADTLIPEISNLIALFPQITNIAVSSVGKDVQNELSALQSIREITVLDHTSKFPFVNRYQTPLTLGIDRLILATGAVLQYPRQNRLVIDAGTCITYDFIDSNDVYHGGAISPGIRLRYESLNNFTARLPLLQMEAPQHYIGNSTAESIHSGIVNGIIAEIDGFIDLYRADYPNFIIILTGGNTEFLANRLKNTIFANSNFLLESLNQTFLYQSNK